MVQHQYTGIATSIRVEDTRLVIHFSCFQSQSVIKANQPALENRLSHYWLFFIGVQKIFKVRERITNGGTLSGVLGLFEDGRD